MSVALIAAALDAEQLQADRDRLAFFGSASRGRPEDDTEIGHTVELRNDGNPYLVEVRHVQARRYEVTVGDATVVVDVERLGHSRSRFTIGSTSYAVVSTIQDSDHLIEIDGVAHRFSRDDAGVVRAPASSLVVRIDVAVDDVVAAGDRLGVLEAMKMEMEIVAPASGRIRDVFSMPNAQVVAGFALFRIEVASGDDDASTGRDSITFDTLAAAASPVGSGDASSAADLVRASLLGFDVSSARACKIVTSSESTGGGIDSESLVAILEVFADLTALAPERLDASNEMRAGREYLNSFLRSLDPAREGVPQWYSDRLVRALAHYGVADLEVSDRLRDAVHRIFVSQQRRDEQLAIVTALLDDPEPSPGLRSTLDRVIHATRRRSPAIASMSRSVRYRLFDRPLIESARAETTTAMKASVDTVVGSPEAHSRESDRLIGCPLPLVPILADDDVLATTDMPGRLVDILLRRFYKIRDLGPVSTTKHGDLEICRAMYVHKERSVHVVGVRATHGRLAHVLAALADIASTVPMSDTAVIDVFMPLASPPTFDTDELSTQMRELLSAATLPEVVRRVALVPAVVDRGIDVLTFRRATAAGVRPYWMAAPLDGANGATDAEPTFEEDIKFRGLHPMIARRLQMWRLANFDISPLPAPGEAHLFDCIARGNPSDRRLIAVAEVRDLTPIRNDAGKVVALPEVEHLLIGCLDAVRRARGELPGATALE